MRGRLTTPPPPGMALDLSTYAAPLLVSGTSGKVLELGARVAYGARLRARASASAGVERTHAPAGRGG